jgi:hypothetical protein
VISVLNDAHRAIGARPHSDSCRVFLLTILIIGFTGFADRARAQGSSGTPEAPQATAGAAAAQAEDEDDASVLNPAEPDFVIVNLPTTARLPVLKGNFRLTHRFAGNWKNRSFNDLAANFFGIDQGAIIGFEFRVGIMRGLQAAAYRSNFARTVQFHAKYDAVRQRGSTPLAASVVASIEGTDNFQQEYAPAFGVVLSRTVGTRLALYATPIWVNNTAATLATAHVHDPSSPDPEAEHIEKQSTTIVGLGARIRVLSRTYLVGEISPRVAGYRPNDAEYGFGIEKRVGQHTFSLTFTNTFATTFSQLARGGSDSTLYLGFNLGRKYY